MTLTLWRGYHSPGLLELVGQAWQKSNLLILCPPHLHDFSFLRFFPETTARTTLSLAGEWDDEAKQSLQSSLSSISRFEPVDFPQPPVYGVFTSGTVSGAPRLVLYSKLNVQSSLAAIRSVFRVDSISNIFCYPQPTHTFGLTLGYVHAHLYGLKLACGSGRYSRTFHSDWLKNVNESTLTLGTPVHFYDLLQSCRETGAKPPASYSCIVGGAKTNRSLWNDLRDTLNIRSPSVGYGATEASPGISHLAPDLAPEHDGDIGTFLPGVSAHLVPGSGVEFEGANVCLAYIQNGAIQFPKRILIRDDLVQSPNGRLRFLGRNELTLNRGGVKIPLELMESVLEKELGLSSICVIVPHPRLGEELGIVARNATLTSDKIFDVLKNKFRQNFDHRCLVFVEELPSTANSKNDRARATRLLETHLQQIGIAND